MFFFVVEEALTGLVVYSQASVLESIAFRGRLKSASALQLALADKAAALELQMELAGMKK